MGLSVEFWLRQWSSGRLDCLRGAFRGSFLARSSLQELVEDLTPGATVSIITEGDYEFGFHNAPRRQYVINLDAAVEIETGDGTKRVLEAGEVLLAEDTTGRGHISRAVEQKPRRSIFVTLD